MLPINRNILNPSSISKDEFLTPFSSLFNDFFNDSFDFLGKDFFEKGSYPKIDIRNEESAIIIEAEIPGLKKEQVTVEVDANILRIKGEKQDVKDKLYVHRELKRSSFCRSFSIGNNIAIDKLTAKFENGILEITLPKKQIEHNINKIKQIKIE